MSWTQNFAVGDKSYIENIKLALGITGMHKSVIGVDDAYALKEPVTPYTTHLEYEMDVLRGKNSILLEKD